MKVTAMNGNTVLSRILTAALAVCVCMLVWTQPSLADDRVILKDGKVLEGIITREVDGYIWIKVTTSGIEQVEFISPSAIERIERDVATDPAGPEPIKVDIREQSKPGSFTRRAGVMRAAIITLEDTVGIYMTAKALHDAIPLLEEEGVDIVIFKINSGGGLLLEIQRLSDVIHYEYKPRFRTVAWIESAISAAAMTAHCIEEIYFMREGNYGACTAFSGALEQVEGRGLEDILFAMEKISARGGYRPEIMRSMQVEDGLSCTIDENGDVEWAPNEEGQYLVNPQGRILTFNSAQALKYKFSKGTAASHHDLVSLMGYNEVDWVGATKPGFAYPISRAEEAQLKYRRQVKEDEDRTREYFIIYDTAIAMAQGIQDRQDRGKFVNRARRYLRNIERMVRNNPNFALLILGLPDPEQFEEWLELQEEILRNLMK